MFTYFSSGTSHKQSLMLPQRQFIASPYHCYFNEVIAKNVNYSTLLPLRENTDYLVLGLIMSKILKPDLLVVPSDVYNQDISAYIASQTKVDFIITQPTAAVYFANLLKTVKYPPTNITVLYLSAEPMTNAAHKLIRQLYPNAKILYWYGMTEVCATIGMRSSICNTLENLHPNAYHLNTRDFISEIENNSLVITQLYKTPFPLIRYHTGDKIVIKEVAPCTCAFPNDKIVIVGPRENLRSYKIGSMIFRAEDIESLLVEHCSNILTKDFRLEIESIATNDQLLIDPILYLKPLKETPSLELTQKIIYLLEKDLIVHPRTSLSTMVMAGLSNRLKIKYDFGVQGGTIMPPKELHQYFDKMGKAEA